jgi:sRNA-binding protein
MMTANNVLPFYPPADIIKAVAAEIVQRWPATFVWPPQPLAVGLGPVMVAALATTPPRRPPWQSITYQQLESAIGFVLDAWCGQPMYLAATRVGHSRVGLDGQPLGKVLREEQVWARKQFVAAVVASGLAGRAFDDPAVRRWARSGLP